MTTFELWQIGIGLTGVAGVFLATFFAYKIGKRQNEINQNLLSLHLVPSLEITCDILKKNIDVINKGNSNTYLWGTQISDNQADMIEEPVLINPAGFYWIQAKDLIDQIEESKMSNVVPIKFFISSHDGKKYIHETSFIFEPDENMKLKVRTQSTPLKTWQI